MSESSSSTSSSCSSSSSLPDNSSSMTFGCDRWPLHYACRVGNMEQVKYLVEESKLPLNEPDPHDATPLYLAALTGRNEICRYLLEKGAKCDDADDKARIYYVALTPELRKMLREWNLSKAASKDPFLDVLRRAFNDPTHADCFVVLPNCQQHRDDGNGEVKENDDQSTRRIYLHSALLQVRCPPLAKLLGDTANKRLRSCRRNLMEICLPALDADSSDSFFLESTAGGNEKNAAAAAAAMMGILEYLYTGLFETTDCPTAQVAYNIAKHDKYQLTDLAEKLEAALERQRRNRELLMEMPSLGRDGNSFGAKKSWSLYLSSSSVFRYDANHVDYLRTDMQTLAKRVSVPIATTVLTDSTTVQKNESKDESSSTEKKEKEEAEKESPFSDYPRTSLSAASASNKHNGDTILRCMDHEWSLHCFLLCSQSEYFQCALLGEFREAQESLLDLSHLVPFPQAVQLAIQWMYSGSFVLDSNGNYDYFLGTTPTRTNISSMELAYVLVELGCAILCPRLVQYVVQTILVPSVTLHNVFDMLQLAQNFDSNIPQQLEDQCVEIFASHLDELVDSTEFQSILAQEAARIRQGGDVRVSDVPLAAEIRSAILRRHYKEGGKGQDFGNDSSNDGNSEDDDGEDGSSCCKRTDQKRLLALLHTIVQKSLLSLEQ